MLLPQTALVPLCPTCTVFFPFCVLHCPFTLFPCSLPVWNWFHCCCLAALASLPHCCTALFAVAVVPLYLCRRCRVLYRPQARGDAWLRSCRWQSALGDRQLGDPWLGHKVMLGL